MENIEKRQEICLLESATTHTVLGSKHFFSSMTLCKANIHTIFGPTKIIDGYGNTTIVLPNGTILHIENALLSGRSRRNLLSYKDVCLNGYHLEILSEQNKEYLCIISYRMDLKIIHEKLEASATGLYYVPIRAIESYTTMPWKLVNPDEFGLWHDRLGHPGATMMCRIIKTTRGHPLKDTKVLFLRIILVNLVHKESLLLGLL